MLNAARGAEVGIVQSHVRLVYVHEHGVMPDGRIRFQAMIQDRVYAGIAADSKHLQGIAGLNGHGRETARKSIRGHEMSRGSHAAILIFFGDGQPNLVLRDLRSEERRVGKECRSRWWAEH